MPFWWITTTQLVLSTRISGLFSPRGLRSEVSKKNFDGIMFGALLYLGAERARHGESSARRSPSFAQLALPGLEARRQVRSLSS